MDDGFWWSITNNNKVWKQLTFAAVMTSKIRVVVNAGADNAYSRVVEVEAWGSQTAGPIKYVLSDIQGSTRAVMSNNGSSSAVIARHDYLPFGEELFSGIGLRSSSQGYGATDTNRQKYGLTERDDATGLDHTWWRKYENLSGRWTSPDPYNGSASIADPQSLNRFSYTQNDPVNFIDPSGLCTFNISITNNAHLSSTALTSMMSEIRRIFGAAGQNVVFNMPRYPGVNSNVSYGITVQSGGTDPGWTPRTSTDVVNSGYASTDRLRESIQFGNSAQGMMGMHPTNFGRALGRVAAHESMHYFLQMFGHSSSGLMQTGFSGSTWFMTADNARFLLSATQAALLGARCGPVSTDTTVPNTQPIMRPLIGGRGGGGGEGYGGGYPWWWYAMWDFANWVNSIQVDGQPDWSNEGPVGPKPKHPPILQ